MTIIVQVDYFERAKRLEEIPLLQKSLEEKQVQDKAFWEQQEKERIQQLIGECSVMSSNNVTLLIFNTSFQVLFS